MFDSGRSFSLNCLLQFLGIFSFQKPERRVVRARSRRDEEEEYEQSN